MPYKQPEKSYSNSYLTYSNSYFKMTFQFGISKCKLSGLAAHEKAAPPLCKLSGLAAHEKAAPPLCKLSGLAAHEKAAPPLIYRHVFSLRDNQHITLCDNQQSLVTMNGPCSGQSHRTLGEPNDSSLRCVVPPVTA